MVQMQCRLLPPVQRRRRW
uniref:Uncharacterized protein n=1 Tax=Rhizophora mucronata TaxID=61149 RepID=A0A2P2NNG3_RHIMU